MDKKELEKFSDWAKDCVLGPVAELVNTSTILSHFEITKSDVWGAEVRKFAPIKLDEGTNPRFVKKLKGVKVGLKFPNKREARTAEELADFSSGICLDTEELEQFIIDEIDYVFNDYRKDYLGIQNDKSYNYIGRYLGAGKLTQDFLEHIIKTNDIKCDLVLCGDDIDLALEDTGIENIVFSEVLDPGVIYFLNSKDFTLHKMCDWRFLVGGDDIVGELVGDDLTAKLVTYCALICSNPNGQWKLEYEVLED